LDGPDLKTPRIDIVAAVTENGVIGANGGMPFKLSTDLKRFKALTLGKPVIMGRKTFDSIGRPLPGRINIVISRQPDFAAEGVISARSLDEAIRIGAAATMANNADAICILGGGEIYAQALGRADRLLITHVEGMVDGDTLFPDIDPLRFEAGEAEFVPQGEKDSHATRYVVYEKREVGPKS
jgi:dihydrofolate reductase